MRSLPCLLGTKLELAIEQDGEVCNLQTRWPQHAIRDLTFIDYLLCSQWICRPSEWGTEIFEKRSTMSYDNSCASIDEKGGPYLKTVTP